MKEGFLLGGGLVIVGLLLQWLLGPVTWDAFAWPVNGIVLAAFLLLIAVLFLQSRRVYALTFLGSYQAAVPALCYAVLLTVIMGFGLYEMLSFWPLVLIYVYVSIILGLVVLRQLRTWAASRFSLRAFRASLLLHLGLFVSSVWAIVIVAIATVDDVTSILPLPDALLYLAGLVSVCAVAYVVFSITTLYYLGYPLLVAYCFFALDRLGRQPSL